MSGVCEYSVEVKSRFSLFWDDSLNNEDPEILISKLQSKRNAEKREAAAKPKSEPTRPKPIIVPVEKQKMEDPPVKEEVTPSGNVELMEPAADMDRNLDQRHSPPTVRARGALRPFSRGFRGGRGRGQAPRSPEAENGRNYDIRETNNVPQRDLPYVPRGRGRGRPRGFVRGRGMGYTDYREYDHKEEQTIQEDRAETFHVASVPRDGDAEHQVEGVAETANVDENREAEVDGVVPPEEEIVTYTLKEYKAMRQTMKPKIALSSSGSRKPNDGKDVFKNMVAHRKLNEHSDEEIEVIEEEPEVEQPFEINVTFTDRYDGRMRGGRDGFGGFDRGRGGRARGDRGGFRGDRAGRGRSSFRGGRGFSRGGSEPQAAPPAINNDQEFPSLR